MGLQAIILALYFSKMFVKVEYILDLAKNDHWKIKVVQNLVFRKNQKEISNLDQFSTLNRKDKIENPTKLPILFKMTEACVPHQVPWFKRLRLIRKLFIWTSPSRRCWLTHLPTLENSRVPLLPTITSSPIFSFRGSGVRRYRLGDL